MSFLVCVCLCMGLLISTYIPYLGGRKVCLLLDVVVCKGTGWNGEVHLSKKSTHPNKKQRDQPAGGVWGEHVFYFPSPTKNVQKR